MSKIQSQSVVKGSLILLSANLLVKFIGAIFKIPLNNLLGEKGFGYFSGAYTIYAGLFIIATAGLPIAVSKMVSESLAKDNLNETKRIFRVAYVIFLIIGVAGSLVLFFGADKLTQFTKYSDSNLAIQALAPAIFFVSIVSVYRGFFQGTSNMIPTAVSEISEALGKLIIGYSLAYILISRGLRLASAGAVLGVTIGTFIALITLMINYSRKKSSIYANYDSRKPAPPTKTILKRLIFIAFPITISASVFTLTSLIDYALIGRRLASISNYLQYEPIELFGRYTGKVITLFNMPPTLVMALCLTLVPAVSRAYVLKDKATIKETATQSLKIATMFALPCAVGLGVLASPILNILFKSDAIANNSAATMLQLISPAIFFVCLVLVSNSLLQATGKVYIPVVNILLGGIAKIIINYTLVGIPSININGAPIGTAVCYFIYMVLNLFYVVKITGADLGFVSFWIKPIISSIVMGVAAYFSYNLMFSITLGYGKLGLIIALAVAIGISGTIYGMMLLLTGGITKKDINVLPKGDKIAGLLIKLKLVRAN